MAITKKILMKIVMINEFIINDEFQKKKLYNNITYIIFIML